MPSLLSREYDGKDCPYGVSDCATIRNHSLLLARKEDPFKYVIQYIYSLTNDVAL